MQFTIVMIIIRHSYIVTYKLNYFLYVLFFYILYCWHLIKKNIGFIYLFTVFKIIKLFTYVESVSNNSKYLNKVV